jgi:hypothetical protein
MKNKFPIFKIKLLLFFLFLSVSGFSQTTIYSENFNSSDGGWDFPNSATNGTKSWEHGNSSLYSTGASVNYMFSKLYAGAYNENTDITATSPVINTSTYSNLYFEIDVWFETQNNKDGMNIEYSLNNGSSWEVLGDEKNLNWYNSKKVKALNNNPGWSDKSGGWVTCGIDLGAWDPRFLNNNQVKFRITFASDNKNNDIGVAFDNILIKGSDYCFSSANDAYNSYNDDIRLVQFNTINWPTDNYQPGYSDFTNNPDPDSSTNVVINSSYDLSVYVNTAGNYWYNVYVWIDWNQDGVFNTFDEQYDLGSVKNKLFARPNNDTAFSITVPGDAKLGNTRMRITHKRDSEGEPTPCDNFTDGEVEDYTINIINACATNVWTGATGKDWNDAVNWSCGTVPTIITNVLIPSGITNYPEIYSSKAAGLSNNIALETGASLIIFDNYIQISGNLLLNGIIDLDGEGQLLQTATSTVDDASTGFIEIDQQGQGNRYRYNDWSSPVIKTGTTAGTSYTVADVLRDGTDPDNPKTIDFVGGYDGSIPGGSGAIKIANYWIYKYANLPSGDYSAWQQIGSTGTLLPGEGFLMKGTGNPGSSNQNYVFVGKPNNGIIGLTVAGNNDYLVGNPYPSAIDANQFILDNANSLRDGTIYFWEHYGGNSHNLADYQAGYAYYNLSGGVVASAHSVVNQSVPNGTKQPQRYIAIGQGFFVWADTDGGSIQFNNNQRVFATETSGSSIFMKGAAQKNSINSKIASDDERPKFRLGFKGEKIDNRQILLTIDENSTDEVDYGYEAEIYEIFEDDMFWTIADKKYVIQATNTIDINKEIPIGVISSGGLISIKMDALENVSDTQEIYIKDKITGGIHTIKNQSFEIDLPKGEYLNRFALTFKSENTLAVEEETLGDDILVFMNNSNKALQIVKPINIEIEAIILYNNLGQIKGYWKEEFLEDSFSLPVKAATGIYFVQINTKNGKIGKKILIE